MAKDYGLRRLIVRRAAEFQDECKNQLGVVDKAALTERVLDALEETDPKLLDTLEAEGARYFVSEAIRETYRATRHGMKGEEGEEQPALPELDAVRGVMLTVPVEAGHDTKEIMDCALWELQAVADDYERRADSMLQHRRFVLALVRTMRNRGFGPADTVRGLYRAG